MSDMDIFSTINSPLKEVGDLNSSYKQVAIDKMDLADDDNFDQILSSDGLDCNNLVKLKPSPAEFKVESPLINNWEKKQKIVFTPQYLKSFMDKQINEGDKSKGAAGWSIKTNNSKLKVWTG